jgi:hypothetical protein
VHLLSAQRFAAWRFATALGPVALAACVTAFVPARVVAQTGTVEYAVKATYLYKFAPYVEWPDGSFHSPSEPLVLCVVGVDAVANLVDEAAQGQTVGGHAVTVRHIIEPKRDSGCHILYVAASPRDPAVALGIVRGTPVLTVTDARPDARAHGIINFVIEGNRVRFEIDLNAAAENHLLISSKLLNLAVRVRQP